ncbi:hypothetical protein KY328_02070 [Candidatus Woesearchaeota archaeon]|nr:hypothetical protein [Candidatus Woesearchaeota archaeon]MBW3021680.1 hypothetical protein [Candidatus Woesearchaeota archaeon]
MAKDAPTGVKVISVLFYILAAVGLVAGLLMLLGAGLVGQLPLGALGLVGAGVFVALGIVMIVVAAVEFFIARGLWKLQNWARIVAVVLAILGILGGVFSLFAGSVVSGVIGLLINGFIAGYLLFSAEAKKAFR